MPYTDKKKAADAQKRYRERRTADKGAPRRCWTLIFYPDSAPPEWPEHLSGLHLRIWVALHDKDVWTEKDEKENPKHKAGTPKKPHYHLICQYDNPVEREMFLEDMKVLRGSECVKAVKSLSSMVRYLVHADDPDKAQYNREDIRVFGGADLDPLDQLGSHERHEALRAMRRFIREHNIVNYCDFVDYCDDMEEKWAHLLDDNSSYTIEKYIRSLRGKMEAMAAGRDAGNHLPVSGVESIVTIDSGTGEVIGVDDPEVGGIIG